MKLIQAETVYRKFIGRRALWTSTFGAISADGKTKFDAERGLEAALHRLVTEDGTPVVKHDARGGTWVAQRENHGSWSYYHVDQTTGERRCVCVVGERDTCLAFMESHMRQWCEP